MSDPMGDCTFTPTEPHRLDAAIARGLGVSRARARQLLDDGRVRVNDRPVAGPSAKAKGRTVQPGDCVTVAQPAAIDLPHPDPDLAAQLTRASPPRILGRDDAAGWIAIDKPPGVPVMPRHPHEQGTLLNAVAALAPGVLGVGADHPEGGGGLRSGVVHRIDTPTSGVVVFALHDAAFHALRAAFRDHRIPKTYLALVQPSHRAAQALDAAGTIWHDLKLPLYVARHRPAHVAVADHAHADHPGLRLCDLRFRLTAPQAWFTAPEAEATAAQTASPDADTRPDTIALHAPLPDAMARALRDTPACPSGPNTPDIRLLEIDLGTGFLHQIRVMLAHIDLPILGDDRYPAPGRGTSVDPAPGSNPIANPDSPAAPTNTPARLMLHAARLELPANLFSRT